MRDEGLVGDGEWRHVRRGKHMKLGRCAVPMKKQHDTFFITGRIEGLWL